MAEIHKEPHLIVAYDRERCIGVNNTLPWAGELSGDMRHFKESTTGQIVLMGRSTFDSIGRALPGRENRVLTRQKELVLPGCRIYHDPEEALVTNYDDERELFVIGGEQLYKLYLPLARFITATEIEHGFDGDTFFPELPDNAWELISQQKYHKDEKNKYNYKISTLRRKSEFIDVAKARSPEQYEQFRRIDIEGHCPFCEDAIAQADDSEMKIIGHEPSWTVIENMIPYENSDAHLVLVSKRHVTTPSELTSEEWLDLQSAIQKYSASMSFGGIALRFGDFTQTGASVAHLHVHIIKPEDNLDETKKVRFKISR